jgi:hypothetical protein
VSEAGDEVVTLGVDEHLGLVFEPTERLGVEDAIAIALKGCPKLVVFFSFLATGTGGGFGCARSQELLLEPFSFFSYSAEKSGLLRRSALVSSS